MALIPPPPTLTLPQPLGTTDSPTFNSLNVTSTVKLGSFTVATLPAAPPVGSTAFASDVVNPAYFNTPIGGGGNPLPVFYDGVGWKVG